MVIWVFVFVGQNRDLTRMDNDINKFLLGYLHTALNTRK